MNDESRGLVRCMCEGYPKGPINLLLMLVKMESVASLLGTRRRNFRSLVVFVFIMLYLYSGVYRPNLSFIYIFSFHAGSMLVFEFCIGKAALIFWALCSGLSSVGI